MNSRVYKRGIWGIFGQPRCVTAEPAPVEEKKTVKMPDYISLDGLRVLVVEDNEMNAEIMQSLLKERGAQAEHAANGKEAVAMFLENPAYYYDTVLMDIQMPEMDGMTATKIIRKSGKEDGKTVPVIAMTATSAQMQAEEAGMNDFIAKPFQIEQIYRVIYQYTRLRNRPDYS